MTDMILKLGSSLFVLDGNIGDESTYKEKACLAVDVRQRLVNGGKLINYCYARDIFIMSLGK